MHVPPYLSDHDGAASLFTRLQRVGIHLELLQRESMRDLPLTFKDFVILATLRREPAPHTLAVTEIAEYVLRPMGSISQALDRVQDAGLVSRATAADDRRRVMVSLTADGVALADEAFVAYEAVRNRVFRQMSDATLRRVDKAVAELLAAMDADYVETHHA